MTLMLYALLIGGPVLLVTLLARLDGRVSERRWQAFARTMASMGLPLRPSSTRSAWHADGLLEGLPLSIEPFQVREGKHTVTRTAVRIPQPVALADAAIYPVLKVPVDALGSMQEVSLDPAFGRSYRVFARRPEEVGNWLSSGARHLIASLGKVTELKVVDGALSLQLQGAGRQRPRARPVRRAAGGDRSWPRPAPPR